MIKEFRKIPNQITLVRILLVPFLYYFAYYNNRTAFILLLVITAITDAFDGFLARRLRQESEFGRSFDSVADKIIYFSLIPWFYFLEKEMFLEKINFIIILAVTAILSQIISLLKYEKLVFRHTILAKTAAVILFISIILGFLTSFNDLIFFPAYLLAILVLFEEIILSIKHKDHDKKRLF